MPIFSCWKGWYRWLLTSLTALALMTGRPGMTSICCMLCCGACCGATMIERLAWWWGWDGLGGGSSSSLLMGVLRTAASESSLQQEACLMPERVHCMLGETDTHLLVSCRGCHSRKLSAFDQQKQNVAYQRMVCPPGGTPAAAGLSMRLSLAKAAFRGRQPSARKCAPCSLA